MRSRCDIDQLNSQLKTSQYQRGQWFALRKLRDSTLPALYRDTLKILWQHCRWMESACTVSSGVKTTDIDSS
eukprot:5660240-Amphidinium_carterae.1